MSTLTHYKQGDTSPDYTATCKDSDGVAVDLTGSAVAFLMRRRSSGLQITLGGTAALVTPASGTVKFTWDTGDLTAGEYEVCFKITFGDGTIRSFPSDGFNRIMVTEQVS